MKSFCDIHDKSWNWPEVSDKGRKKIANVNTPISIIGTESGKKYNILLIVPTLYLYLNLPTQNIHTKEKKKNGERAIEGSIAPFYILLRTGREHSADCLSGFRICTIGHAPLTPPLEKAYLAQFIKD